MHEFTDAFLYVSTFILMNSVAPTTVRVNPTPSLSTHPPLPNYSPILASIFTLAHPPCLISRPLHCLISRPPFAGGAEGER